MFSFAQGVKKEISLIFPLPKHCEIAEIAAIINHFGAFDGEKLAIVTENVTVAARVYKLIKDFTKFKPDITRRESKRSHCYTVAVNDAAVAAKILMASGLYKNGELSRETDALVLKSECCRRAYIRGAFLCHGSISRPEKGYHLEISHRSSDYLQKLCRMIAGFSLNPKITKRKSRFIIYIKDGEEVVDMLNIMGAHKSLMEMENERILKDVRNTVTRTVNCETANIDKVAKAAAKQLSDIRFVSENYGLESLPEGLYEIALLRINNPEASLTELGEMLSEPIGKSGVNHRLRKISEMVKEF